MSSQYYKITRRLGTPHRNSVTVTIPLVGPQGPAGPQGEQGPPGEVSGSLAWDNVTDKPTTFPPSAHTHQASEIVDFTSAVEAVSPPADWNTLANKPSTFPPSSHGHVAADVSDFSTAAAAAAPVQSVAGKTGSVTLAKADVGLGNVDNTSDTNKPISSATQSALDGKAATSHTHTASQVTDFTAAAAAAAPVQSVNGNTGTVTVAVPSASTATPQALGTAAAGTSDDYSRADHIHAAPALNDLSNVSAATPSDNDVLVYDTATGNWVAEAPAAGGIAGSTGSTDNAILRADGTGGSTAQASAIVIEDAVSSFTGVTGDASTDIITVTGSGFSNGQKVRFTALTGGSGLNTTTNYFVIGASGDTFQLSTTEGGSFVNFTTNITAGTLLNGHFTQVHTQITNAGTDTNIPFVINTKGAGALIFGPPPDNTTTGGNSRGANAVDLQVNRATAARVASGQQAFVCGVSNTASGNASFVAGGQFNTASGSPSFATGAQSNASGYSSAAFSEGLASGSHAFAVGRLAVADRSWMIAFAAGRHGADSGSAQRIFYTLFERTSTDSAAELLTAIDAQGIRRRLTVPSNKAIGATIQIIGTTSGNETANYYVRQCLIRNRAGTTELVGAVQDIGTDIEGVTVGGVTITASDADDALVVEATGYTPVTGCTADAGTEVISKTAHGFNNNDDIVFTSLTGGAGLTANTVTYWVIDANADDFKVSATRGGAAVNITTNYTDMTATRIIRWVANIHASEVIAGTSS